MSSWYLIRPPHLGRSLCRIAFQVKWLHETLGRSEPTAPVHVLEAVATSKCWGRGDRATPARRAPPAWGWSFLRRAGHQCTQSGPDSPAGPRPKALRLRHDPGGSDRGDQRIRTPSRDTSLLPEDLPVKRQPASRGARPATRTARLSPSPLAKS